MLEIKSNSYRAARPPEVIEVGGTFRLAAIGDIPCY